MALRSFSFAGFLILFLMGAANALVSTENLTPSATQTIYDLKEAIAKGLGFPADDFKISYFDPRDALVGHSVAYEFDIEVDKKVLPFKLLEDVNRWEYVDLPIFRAEDPSKSGDENSLVESRRTKEPVLPVLAPFQLAGPMELWIQDAKDMRLSLPHDVDAGVLKKVILADGAVVTVKGARSVSLRHPLDLPLPLNLTRNGFASGLMMLADGLRFAARTQEAQLLSLRIVGPTSLTSPSSSSSTKTSSPDYKLKLKRLAPGLVELSSPSKTKAIEAISALNVDNEETTLLTPERFTTLWPLASVNGSNPNLLGFEALLSSVLGEKAKEEGSFKLLKAEASAQTFVKMVFGVEKRLKGGDGLDLEGLPEWRTKPEHLKLHFEVLAKVEGQRVIPEKVADLNPPLKQLVHGLDREGSTYDNSKARERPPSVEWKCSRAKAQLVFITWKCSQGAYNTARDPVNTLDYTIQSDFVETPSVGAGIEAWTSTLICPKADTTLDSEYLPVLVVSIQGNPSKMDHVLNPNDKPRDANHFINPGLWGGSQPLAHGGFLNAAEAMSHGVSQKIQSYLESPGQRAKHVLITGHSAGGAVASLLFLHYLSKTDLAKRARFSCITFGSAPSVTTPIDLSNYHQSSNTPTIALNIINEFDLVSRADRPYIMSLVNLVRSVYGHRPIPLVEDATAYDNDKDEGGALDDSPSSKGKQSSIGDDCVALMSRDFASTGRNIWPVPKLFYHHVGTRVVLMMRLGEDEIQLRVVEVPASGFEKLLFCRLLVHGWASYSERVQLIYDGVFNKRKGWTGKESQVPIVPDVLGRLY